jgi:hypothetical protein
MAYGKATDDTRFLAQHKTAGILGVPCWIRFTPRVDSFTSSRFQSEVGLRPAKQRPSLQKSPLIISKVNSAPFSPRHENPDRSRQTID